MKILPRLAPGWTWKREIIEALPQMIVLIIQISCLGTAAYFMFQTYFFIQETSAIMEQTNRELRAIIERRKK